MEHTTYASRLRYLDASDVDDGVVDYDGLSVAGTNGERVGEVDGFIVDTQAGRVHYIVVDSAGWFRSQRVLIPVGHATLDSDRRTLRLDLTQDALRRYPAFDEDRFREFSDDELRRFETEMDAACCPDEPPVERYGLQRHYAQPEWWTPTPYPHERLRPVDTSAFADMPPPPDRETFPAERIRAQGDALEEDLSPHVDGRAQPGDVLGIETGGERTHVGETAEDENRRRRVAERALVDDEERGSER